MIRKALRFRQPSPEVYSSNSARNFEALSFADNFPQFPRTNSQLEEYNNMLLVYCSLKDGRHLLQINAPYQNKGSSWIVL